MAEEDLTAVRRPTAIALPGERHSCILVLSGPEVGRTVKLDQAKVIIGRADDADLRVDDDGISRHHAKLMSLPNGVVTLTDLESLNGTFVNGQPVRTRALEDGDRIQLGATTVLKFSIHDSLEEQFQEKLYASATRDALTGAHNRRYFSEHLAKDVSHAQRHLTQLSLLIIDIDHFKAVNDTYGHLAGDQVLRELGVRLTQAIRTEDVFARLGGEEFGVILRENPLPGAIMLAERLRRGVEARPFEHQGVPITVTISLGVASHAKERHRDALALVAEADRYLYQAKQSGRNRVQGPS
jgi:diguanylate cyclase (GGDEF)-like protein